MPRARSPVHRVVRVGFRVDASTLIGGGHVFRCLTLAEELKLKGVESMFVCREHAGDLVSLIERNGYAVKRLPARQEREQHLPTAWRDDVQETATVLQGITPLDWMVIDHYGIDEQWESEARKFAARIMVIDDLANRRHDCDVLLDQNYYLNAGSRYDGLIAPSSRLLLGPGNALLREEFHTARQRAVPRISGVKRILVSFGSSDPTGETEKALVALELAGCAQLEIVVVIGSTNPRQRKIASRCTTLSDVRLLVQTDRMSELCLAADLSLGAGGSTMWERCLLGLPTIVVITAENQSEVVQAVSTTDAIVNCGHSRQVRAADIGNQIRSIMHSNARLESMSKACFDLMRLLGPVSSAASMICELSGRRPCDAPASARFGQ